MDESKAAGAVVVCVTIHARPETVWGFLSDPLRIQEWLGPGTRFEPRVGAELVVHGPAGSGPAAHGRVLELVPNRRLVFDWGHAAGSGGLPPSSSRVCLELEACTEGTRVTLTHSGLPSDAGVRGGTHMGWNHYLGQLALCASRDQHAFALETTVDLYCAAWNEADAGLRAQHLELCFAPDGRYADPFASFEGREALLVGIAAARQFMPGVRLARSGPVEFCQGALRFPWCASQADGSTLATGWDTGRVDLEGRLCDLTGWWDPVPRS